MEDLIDEIHGKMNRKSSNVFKTSKTRYKVFFVYCYDPEKPERKTYRRWKNRDNLRYATQLAKLDYNNYPAERAKYEKAFDQQDKYTQLFHYIVACHKLALDRADAMTQKPSGKAMEWLNMFFVMQHVGCTKKNDTLAKDLASERFAKICNAVNQAYERVCEVRELMAEMMEEEMVT